MGIFWKNLIMNYSAVKILSRVFNIGDGFLTLKKIRMGKLYYILD
jgi:hypothetical protein